MQAIMMHAAIAMKTAAANYTYNIIAIISHSYN